ncbi:hypothetical protein ACWY4P_43855 [Streptomyces sp. LZ34]
MTHEWASELQITTADGLRHVSGVFRLPSYATRIQQVLDRFDPRVLAQAATQVTDQDEEIPLRPEELTA